MFPYKVTLAAREHAIVEYPKESCGIVSDGTYIRMKNIAADPVKDFEIDPAAYLFLLDGPGVEAVIHSHPNGPDCPTLKDMQGQIACAVPWGIVAVTEKQAFEPFFWGDQLPIDDLLGRSFRMGVHDCYALVRDWYKTEMGIMLPAFPREPFWWEKKQNVIAENFEAMGFAPIDKPAQVGDGVIGRINCDVENHCGVYIGDGLVLHHLYNRLSRREPIGPWMKHITRTFRHKDAK